DEISGKNTRHRRRLNDVVGAEHVDTSSLDWVYFAHRRVFHCGEMDNKFGTQAADGLIHQLTIGDVERVEISQVRTRNRGVDRATTAQTSSKTYRRRSRHGPWFRGTTSPSRSPHQGRGVERDVVEFERCGIGDHIAQVRI